MNKRWKNVAVGVGSAVLVLVGLLLAVPLTAAADEVPVNMRPDVIVLNAQGDAEDVVVAQIVMPMTPGHSIQSFYISLRFDGVHVADAFALDYCYTDGFFSASFDKKELLQNQDVIDMANSTVTARVEGQITTADVAGDSVVMEFFGVDDMEIVLPDPCWGDFDDDGDVDGADLADFLAGDNWTAQQLETLAGEFGRDDCPLPVNNPPQ
jgi:hypothetical protein